MIIAVVSDVLGEENNGTTIAAMNLIRSLRAMRFVLSALTQTRPAKTVII